MKARGSSPFRSKLFNPCTSLVQFFKVRFRKPLSIRAIQSRHPRKTTLRKRLTKFIPILNCFRPSRDMDRVMELKSFSDAGYIQAPFPSPLTPAYVKLSAGAANNSNSKRGVSEYPEDVEDACRSFENYLVEMMVEEGGKMKDLMDVEELLHCWKNLKSPVFIDLVCRFYGELCRDLFSNANS